MDEITLKRLLFTKRLFHHGVQHSNKNSEIERFLAIHHFDNALELFLKVVGIREEIINSNKQDFKFKDLFNEIYTKLEQNTPSYKLPLKDQIFTLHDTRNLAQHQGDAPSFSTIIKYRGYTKDFLHKCFKDIFKIDFDKIYAASLVKNDDVKKLLIESEKNMEKANFKKSIELSIKSFDLLKFNGNGNFSNVIDINRDEIIFRPHSLDTLDNQCNQNVISLIEELNELLSKNARNVENIARIVQEEFSILKLGVDYIEYDHFDTIRNKCHRFNPNHISKFVDIPDTIDEQKKKLFNEENATFCYEFVLETVLKYQGFFGKDKT